MLSDYCLSCPVCDVGVLWPKGWMDHDATWYGGSPRLKLHCLRCGLSYLPTERGTAAQQPPLSAHVYYGGTHFQIPRCSIQVRRSLRRLD